MIWTTKKSVGSSRCACRDVIITTVGGNMGDCVNLRCAQEKRHFRKELISWYKKIPFTIGLELVAENLAGNSSGHIKTLLLPFNDMETEAIEDFKPPSEFACIFCEGKPVEESLEQENIPEPIICSEQTTSSQSHKVSSIPKGYNGDTINSSYTSSAAGDMPTLEGLSSFYNQLAMTSLLYQQQQLQSAAAVKSAFTGGIAPSPPSHSKSQKQAELLLGLPQNALASDLALDFQAAASSCSTSHDLDLHLSAAAESGDHLKVPDIRRKMKRENSLKKSYTDRELNAAVEAIKSGTIGTRRAAQMYGVPRSTLRNKVFKSSETNRQMSEVHGALSGTAALDENCESPPPSKSDSESQTSSPTNKHTSHRGKLVEEHTSSNMTQYNDMFLKQLEELKTKQGINDQLTMMSHQNRLLGEMFNPLQFAAASGYPFFMPQYSALTGMPGFDYMNTYAPSMMMPYLPELMKNLAQKQLESDHASHLTANMQTTSARKSEHYNSNSKASLKVTKDDIKVPAYKPLVNSHVGSSSQLSTAGKGGSKTSNKDQMEKLPEMPSTFSAANYLQRMISPSTSNRNSPQPSHSPSKRSFSEASHNSTQQTHSSLQNGNSSGKKRPKRGQYRKYDSELLAQAVRSVQRGEMSVHRAGTHYGVPHSTLEYKVKERHLLRKKKIAENVENKASMASAMVNKPSSTNIISSNNSSDSFQSDSKPVSPKLEIDESNKTSSSNKESTTPGFLHFSPPYNLNTSASELLMKLQDKVHQKAMNEIMNGGEKPQENTSVSTV